MAQTTSLSSLIPPAQLFVGPHAHVADEVQKFLQERYCTRHACGLCATCQQLAQRQHHGVVWITPEKNYTLDDVEPIFETTSFSLNAGENFFFVLQKADLLTTTCANKLLKILEEPPTGYHFILCTERDSLLLPTIKSRCTVRSFFGTDQQALHPNLFSFFVGTAPKNPLVFLKELDASKINEQESLELLDQLIEYWAKKYKEGVITRELSLQKHAEKKAALFSEALLTPPMPGSSKIFWKNLFLQNG